MPLSAMVPITSQAGSGDEELAKEQLYRTIYAGTRYGSDPWNRLTPSFVIKIALYELARLVSEGMAADDFEATRRFLSRYVDVLVATEDARLGYAIDSEFYGAGEFSAMVRENLARMTVTDVNLAIKRHLQTDNLKIVIVSGDAEALKEGVLGGACDSYLSVADASNRAGRGPHDC